MVRILSISAPDDQYEKSRDGITTPDMPIKTGGASRCGVTPHCGGAVRRIWAGMDPGSSLRSRLAIILPPAGSSLEQSSKQPQIGFPPRVALAKRRHT